MAKKGKKSTLQEAEAGRQNLLAYREKNPAPALTHGAYSGTIRKRYSDKRTSEGRQLYAILEGLKADLGGADKLTAAQCLILEGIRSKLIVLLQIGKYADHQVSLINVRGELLPCLGRNYTGYSEALRRDLEALTAMASKKPSRIPTIEEIVAKGEKE